MGYLEWANGRQIETEDAANFAQCMDLAFGYLDNIGIGRAAIRNLYAWQVCGNYDSSKLDKVSNPQYGDLVIWNQAVGTAGHIAIFLSGSKNNFTSLDQNWDGVLKARQVNHNNYGVSCFLRPKGASNMATYNEEKVNRGDITNIYREAILRDPNDNDFAAWDGKGWKQFTYDLVARGDFVKKRFEAADASFKQVYAALQDSEKIVADRDKTIADLKEQLKSAQNGSGGLSEQDRVTINETNSIVKQIWAKITGIFK